LAQELQRRLQVSKLYEDLLQTVNKEGVRKGRNRSKTEAFVPILENLDDEPELEQSLKEGSPKPPESYIEVVSVHTPLYMYIRRKSTRLT